MTEVRKVFYIVRTLGIPARDYGGETATNAAVLRNHAAAQRESRRNSF